MNERDRFSVLGFAALVAAWSALFGVSAWVFSHLPTYGVDRALIYVIGASSAILVVFALVFALIALLSRTNGDEQ